MDAPTFNNVPNEHLMLKLQTNSGNLIKDIWISRAVALVGFVFAMLPTGGLQVLTTKRSAKMRDDPNKHCVPCGYLDNNETCHEVMTREVYEETSLYIPHYKDYITFDNYKKPFTIHDNPKDNRQNVSMLYITVLDFRNDVDKFPKSVEMYTDKETAAVNWLPLIDLYGGKVNWEWAFRHDETIKEAVEFIRIHQSNIILD